MKTTSMGDKKGRLYVERQNLDAIALKKRKVLKIKAFFFKLFFVETKS